MMGFYPRRSIYVKVLIGGGLCNVVKVHVILGLTEEGLSSVDFRVGTQDL